jgi:hypothetical protein
MPLPINIKNMGHERHDVDLFVDMKSSIVEHEEEVLAMTQCS